MRSTSSVMVKIAGLAMVLTAVSGPISADEPSSSPSPEAVMKALEEAGKPTAEHKKLQPLVGEWTYTIKTWMDPSQPPQESVGTIQRRWILDGRFVEESVAGKGPDGKSDFEGRGVIGYDKAEKKYTYGWICSMGTGIATSLGTSDASGKHFTFETNAFCPLRGRKVPGRDVIHIQSDDKHVMEVYQSLDGKELKVMELTAVRKK